MTVRVQPYECKGCGVKFLREEQEFSASGAAFGFRSTSEDAKCPQCGSSDLLKLEVGGANVQELMLLYGKRFGLGRGGGG